MSPVTPVIDRFMCDRWLMIAPIRPRCDQFPFWSLSFHTILGNFLVISSVTIIFNRPFTPGRFQSLDVGSLQCKNQWPWSVQLQQIAAPHFLALSLFCGRLLPIGIEILKNRQICLNSPKRWLQQFIFKWTLAWVPLWAVLSCQNVSNWLERHHDIVVQHNRNDKFTDFYRIPENCSKIKSDKIVTLNIPVWFHSCLSNF